MTLKFIEIDKEVYEYIKSNNNTHINKIIDNLSLDSDSIRRSLEFLKSENIILEKIEQKEIYDISDIGKIVIEKGLIEGIFCDYLKDKEISMIELKNLEIPNLSKEEVSLAFGISKRNNLITIDLGKIKVNEEYNSKVEQSLNYLKDIHMNQEVDKEIVLNFLKRKFLIKKLKVDKSYSLLKEVEYAIEKDNTLNLTSELLKTGNYKNIKFKEFDVEKLPKQEKVGRLHPLRQVINYIRDLYLEMGFKEMKSPYIDTSFWPMDSMFISQDHPMRDIQDTFYLPYEGDLPDAELLNKIAKVHETGGETGSLGHQYKWELEKAKQLILRTHTTAATYRKFYELSDEEKKESKYFSIGKVFRNETIDSTHLPEFHQAEGFVIGQDLSLADLIGFIKVFLGKLGLDRIKIKPTYNPYTEPSVEVFAFSEKSGKWFEVMNSGVFRKESLEPYGITNNVIAWGMGIERIAMLIYKKHSIKEIYGDECDLDWLRSYTLPKRKLE